MVTCPKCGKKLEDGSKFCDDCGAKIVETIFCPNCGARTSTEFAFCQECGAAIGGDAGKESGGQDQKKAPPKKALLIGGAVVAVVAVIAIVMSLMGGGGKSGKNYAFYLKDGEINYTDFSKGGPREVSERLLNGDSVEGEVYASMEYSLNNMIAVRGDTVFYPDRSDLAGYGYLDRVSLYYKDLRKADAEGTKIDSDIVRYKVNGAGTLVTYMKGAEGVLYQHNLKDKTKIASDVSDFWVSDDGKTVAYLDIDSSLYLWNGEKEKLATDIGMIYHVSKDLSTFYYTREGALYVQKAGADREKIANDVTTAFIYESGEVYYVVARSEQVKLSEYINDPDAAGDAAMTRPAEPQYPNYWDYLGDEAGYQAALAQYNSEYAAYQAAYELYRAKENRDRIRERLADTTVDNDVASLFYYDGTSSVMVTESMAGPASMASNAAVAVVQIYEQSDVTKINLSDVSNISDMQNMVQEALYSAVSYYVAVGTELTQLEQEKAFSFYCCEDGSKIAFLDEMSSDNDYGELYVVNIDKNGKVGSPERYDSDVNPYTVIFLSDGSLRYFKDVDHENSKGDLYLNKSQVDYDVYLYNLTYHSDSSTIYYYSDWSYDRSEGTLKFYNGKETTKVADDVHAMGFTANDQLLYLNDFSSRSCKGTLYLYNSKGAEKIDDDVSCILQIDN